MAKTNSFSYSHLTLFLLVIISAKLCDAQQNGSAIPFLPDTFIEFPSVRDLTVSANVDEVYFTVQDVSGLTSTIVRINKNGKQWSSPKISSFNSKYLDLEPYLSQDGLKLYFASNRPVVANDGRSDYNIWHVTRKNKNSNWSEPSPLPEPVNSLENEFYPALATNGNLYFTYQNTTSNILDDINMCIWNDNQYEQPVSVGSSINTKGYKYNAFIAPDESYLVFGAYNREDGFGSGDLYISWKTQEGWTEGENLGSAINSEYMDYCPFIDQDDNLYFTSRRSGIDKENPKISTLSELYEQVNRYDNGLSRIYIVSLTDFLQQNKK